MSSPTLTQEMRSLLQSSTGRLAQRGYTVSIIALIVVFASLGLVHYPQTVQTLVTISTSPAPVYLIARIDGRIEQLLVDEPAKVDSGQAIAILHSEARYSDVRALQAWLRAYPLADQGEAEPIPPHLVLGEAQDEYAAMIRAFLELKATLLDTLVAARIREFDAEAQVNTTLADLLARRSSIAEQGATIEAAIDSSNLALLQAGGLTSVEFQRSQTAMLTRQSEALAAREEVLQHRLRVNELRRLIIESRQADRDHRQATRLSFLESREKLEARLREWEQRYVLVAPRPGQLARISQVSVGQNVRTGETIIGILPHTAVLFGMAYIGQERAGLIAPGQLVRLRLRGFPFQDYGTVTATVASVAELPNDSRYLVRMTLPRGLTTSSGAQLQARFELEADGEIITRESSLLWRLIGPVRKVLTSVSRADPS